MDPFEALDRDLLYQSDLPETPDGNNTGRSEIPCSASQAHLTVVVGDGARSNLRLAAVGAPGNVVQFQSYKGNPKSLDCDNVCVETPAGLVSNRDQGRYLTLRDGDLFQKCGTSGNRWRALQD